MKAATISGSTEPYQLSTISEIELPSIQPNQLLIKSQAFAINPTDWKHILKPTKPGNIIGCDVSGTVSQVGSDVTGFSVGAYVSSFIHGNISPTQGAFGEYAIVNPRTTIKYRELKHSDDAESRNIDSFEGAASITLGLATVALSFSYSLGIGYDKQKNENKFILIWSGATATGILAIQIAKLIYNLKVITTSSPKHHQYLTSLGADYVFDYHDPEVVDNIKQVGQGKIFYALDTIATPSSFQQVYNSTEGASKVFLDSLLARDDRDITTDPKRKVKYGYTIAYLAFDKEYTINGKTITQTKEMVIKFDEFWKDHLPKYIDQIKHSKLLILQDGLESVNQGLELSRLGKLSGQKVVFRL